MEKYGLLGFPLGHSFSRKFFNEKFQKEGIHAEYVNFEIPEIGILKQIIDNETQLKGLNVTIPYKEQVIPFLDEMSDEARIIGAVNVIRISRIKGQPYLKGFNSDIIGFKNSIHPLLKPHHRKALILGTGGASKAIRVGLEQMGLETCYVSRKSGHGILDYSMLDREIINDFTVIVNCTPCGMHPHTDTCPPIPYELITESHLLYDLVYNPEETLFMQKGKAQGATTCNGMEMLRLQALAGWDFWHNKDEL